MINRLIICAKNAPLLLLATGKHLTSFCHWLLGDAEGITIEEKQEFLTYLVNYNLIENEEIAKTMKFQLFGPPQYDWIFEGVAEKPKDYQDSFYETALEKMMITTSAEQIAQKALGATSSQELAQKALGASSPFEAVLKLVKSEEERRQLIALLLQEGQQDTTEE